MLKSLEDDLPMLKSFRKSAFDSKNREHFSSKNFKFGDHSTQNAIFKWIRQASKRDKKVLLAKLDSASSDWTVYKCKGVQNIFDEN